MIETVLDKVVAFIKESRYSELIFIDIETVSFVSFIFMTVTSSGCNQKVASSGCNQKNNIAL